MERLTTEGYKYHSCDFMEDGICEMVNRLSEYEDTGLTPKEIKDGQMLTGWIPVGEQLPPRHDTVLLTVPVNRGMSHGRGSLDVGFLYDNGSVKGFYGADGRYKVAEVFAWMPLPKPYRPEEE